MRNRSSIAVIVLAVVGLSASASAAIVPTIVTFDSGADDFIGSTIATTQIHQAAGGNPNGHIQIRKDLSTGFDIGSQNSTWASLLGNYIADDVKGAGFDLNVFNTSFDEAHLRFRRNTAENGWFYDFGAVAPNANQWKSFDVAFNPAWDNATAAANGWTREVGAPNFIDLMVDVGWIEVRVINTGSAIAGIDNVRLTPEPSALALLAAGALFGLRRFRS